MATRRGPALCRQALFRQRQVKNQFIRGEHRFSFAFDEVAPVLTVGPAVRLATAFGPIRRVLSPVDLVGSSQVALQHAAGLVKAVSEPN